MAITDDMLQAKQVLSARLLQAGVRGGVIGMTRGLRVNTAVLAAGHNVHAVGVGHKIVEGKTTSEPCVRLYVVQKIAPSLLLQRDVLPERVDGIATDIIESPPALIQPRKAASRKATRKRKMTDMNLTAAAAPACTNDRRRRQRPINVGISTAHFQVTAGTISCFCRSVQHGDNPSTVFVLSNNHVFADVNRAHIGDNLFQPGPADGGGQGDHFAELHRFVHIQLGGTAPNRVDAAIGRLLPGIDINRQVCSIGAITGIKRAEENLEVRKHGRTTGFTEGFVFDPSIDSLVGMDHSDPSVVALFQNQMRINVSVPFTAFGLGGDSGSLVLDRSSGEAVGLYFAGPQGGEYGLANQIEDVVTELQVELL